MPLFNRNKGPARPKSPPVYLSWENNTNSNWLKDPGLRRNALWALVLYLGSVTMGFDGSYLTSLQLLPSWNNYFDTPSGTRLGLFTASTYFPLVAFAPFQGTICDIIGRRLTIAVGSLILICGAVVGACATSDGMFIAGRVIVGLGNGFGLFGTNILLNEILHPRLRSISSAGFFVFYYVGSAAAAWIGFIAVEHNWNSDASWRVITALQGAGPFILLICSPFMPESPRWLIAKGKDERAHKILAHYHANGKMDDELVVNEVDEIKSAITRESNERAGWSSFFATPGNRRRLLVLLLVGTGSQLNGVAIISYYLGPVLNTVGVTDPIITTGINAGIAMWNLVLAGVGASLVERVGRRKLWITSTAGMLVCYIFLTGLSGGFDATQNQATGLTSIAFLFLTFGFYDIAWTPLSYSYTVELLPYSLRAKGMSLFIWSQQASLVFNGFVNPIALEQIGWRYYFVWMATLTFYLVMAILFFKETRGLSLEEVGMLYDRPDNDRADKKQAILSELRDPSLPAGTKFNGAAAEIRHLEDEETAVGLDSDSSAPVGEKK
ncbi:uncharacterized protein JCM10292_002285 [Rhodotorula paludigena]|uniref:uncharacterized protein n=1 Tax=Rhodotorula paludigena TaxID=86838 RepID=UPI00316F10C1